MSDTSKAQAPLNLTEEIELRQRLRSTLEGYINSLSDEAPLAGGGPNSAFDLADLLLEVRDLKKRVEEQEATVRAKLNDLIPDSGILSAGGLIVLRESKERTNLDKAKLRADLGSLEKYEKKTSYVTVSVKRGEAV